MLHPYIKSYEVFSCPSAQRMRASASAVPVDNNWWFPLDWQGVYLDYGYNFRLRGKEMSQVRAPAETLAIADCAHAVHACCWTRIAYANMCGVWCNPDSRTEGNARHTGGSNIAFADGHVKWLKAERILSIPLDTLFGRW